MTNTDAVVQDENRIAAILAYCSPMGLVIAFALHLSNKTMLSAFHLRQALGLLVTSMFFGMASVVLLVIPVLGWLAIIVGALGLFLLLVTGIIGALRGKESPLPFVGASYQRWFAKLVTV